MEHGPAVQRIPRPIGLRKLQTRQKPQILVRPIFSYPLSRKICRASFPISRVLLPKHIAYLSISENILPHSYLPSHAPHIPRVQRGEQDRQSIPSRLLHLPGASRVRQIRFRTFGQLAIRQINPNRGSKLLLLPSKTPNKEKKPPAGLKNPCVVKPTGVVGKDEQTARKEGRDMRKKKIAFNIRKRHNTRKFGNVFF